MKRFSLWFGLFTLMIMGFGTYYAPDDSLFWLASNDLIMQAVRIVLSLVLLVQLLTDPPRHMAVRSMTGLIAVGTAAWALQASTFMSTPIYDTAALLQVAVALGIAALERPISLPPIVRSSPPQIHYVVKT